MNVTHILRYFGVILLAIDREMKVPRTLNCGRRNLVDKKQFISTNSSEKFLKNIVDYIISSV